MPIRFRLTGDAAEPGKFLRSTTTNVSQSGLAFLSPVELPIRGTVEIELTLPGGAGEVRAETTIMRIAAEFPDERTIEYGVELAAPPRSEVLEKFVRAIDLMPWLQRMAKQGASDLYFSAFAPPTLRIQRDLVPADSKPMNPEIVEALVLGALSRPLRLRLKREREVCFALVIPELGRWRVTAYHQRGFVEAAFHFIGPYIPTLEDLGLPETVRDLALGPGGLVLVTGPAGNGKSTTLASLVDAINSHAKKIIVSLEDPIEYVHENNQSIIQQREIGHDTLSFAAGMRSVLRETPDAVVVSDLRDLETVDMVLRATETGCLVLAGMPTSGPTETLCRIISMYPPSQRNMVLHMLAGGLRGIVCQRLLRAIDKTRLVLAVEVLVCNEGVRGAIRTDRLDQIPYIILGAPGGQLMDISLRNLILRGLIDMDTALHVAHDPERLRKLLGEHRA
jgi:twitching motility protein PilT